MVEMLVFRNEWPCGVIDPFVIDEIVDVCVDSYGDYLVARLLPFENQGSKTTCKLLTKLVQRADKQGSDALKSLPITRWGEQHPTPHPMASELNRLLEQVPDVDNEEEAF